MSLSLDLLSLIDVEENMCKKVGNNLKVSNDVIFKYQIDDNFYNVIEKAYDIQHYNFLYLGIDEIKYARKKNMKFGYICIFNDVLYVWNFNEKDLMLQYNFDGKTDNYNVCNVSCKNLKKL